MGTRKLGPKLGTLRGELLEPGHQRGFFVIGDRLDEIDAVARVGIRPVRRRMLREHAQLTPPASLGCRGVHGAAIGGFISLVMPRVLVKGAEVMRAVGGRHRALMRRRPAGGALHHHLSLQTDEIQEEGTER